MGNNTAIRNPKKGRIKTLNVCIIGFRWNLLTENEITLSFTTTKCRQKVRIVSDCSKQGIRNS